MLLFLECFAPAFFLFFASILLLYGWAHEDKFIRFEDWLWNKIKRRVRIWKRNLSAKWLAKDGLTVVPRTASFEDVIEDLIPKDK